MPSKELAVDARSLRHPLHLESPPEDKGANSGRAKGAWTRYASPRGKVAPLSGREFWQAQGVEATASHRVTIRYDPRVETDHRVVYRGRHFYVSAPPVDVEERGVFMVLLCTERA